MTPSQRPGRYHHGDLAEALVSAAVDLIAEQGTMDISVREVARRAGVSPGAPFRHYKNKAALMTAVAEQAMSRLSQSVEDAVARRAGGDPLNQIEAIGVGYLDWAISNPVHFKIVSARDVIDFAESTQLQAENDAIRDLMIGLFQQAEAEGLLRGTPKLDDLLLSCRAFVYGLARMGSDGHFPEWHVVGDYGAEMRSALSLFIQSLRVSPPSA